MRGTESELSSTRASPRGDLGLSRTVGSFIALLVQGSRCHFGEVRALPGLGALAMNDAPLLSSDDFRKLAMEALGVDLGKDSPHGALLDPTRPNLIIPAGAGAGKTTGLALLALQALFVHGFQADAVLATTFTRKAAA